MNWTGFYALSNAWLLLLLLPLVILYFLKLKRPRTEIPSLALWQQVVNDQRVNSPFQKFKRNLLLLLQLLLLMSLILAAMQPFLRSGVERAQYIPVLVDCSASMAAVDEEGVTRLDAAKNRIEKLIDDLLPDQRVSLLAVGSTARRLTSFTDNKRLLKDALRRVEVMDVPSRLEDAFRLVQAMTRSNPIESIVLYSDGNVPERIDFELPFEVNYQRVPTGDANIGITALNARRSEVGKWNLFARIQASDHVVAAKVIVDQDGESIAEDYVKLERGASQRLVFRVSTSGVSDVSVRLEPDGADSLPSDNRAALRLPASRPLAVYCDPRLQSFRHAIDAIAEVDLYPSSSSDASVGRSKFDLLISDGPISEGYDATVRLAVGYVPTELEQTVVINPGAAAVIDWQRNAPILQHVELSTVIFSEEPSSFPGISDADYEALGYEILAHSRNAPLVLKKRSDAQIVYQLLFHPDKSTLPYQVGFPVMVANAVGITLREAELSDVRGAKTGVLPSLSVSKASTAYEVTSPSGKSTELTSNEEGMLGGAAAPQVGQYTLRSGEDEHVVHAALLSAQETGLGSVEQLQFRELSVGAADQLVQNDRPLWPILAMGGFALLLAEWWFSNRRPDAF